MKDNFSLQSDNYAAFRPAYPDTIYEFILAHVTDKKSALDCGTGNGQVASKLSEYFDNVHAIDISEKQLNNAFQKPNILYTKSGAEHTPFSNSHFDLITVGQAAHWFDLPKFYSEVSRILKPGGVLALFGYTLPIANPEVDSLLDTFYNNVLGPYWDMERKYVDDCYSSLYFPFPKIINDNFEKTYLWSRQQYLGYLSTWSGLQHYKRINSVDPISEFGLSLEKIWHDSEKIAIQFPVFMVASNLISNYINQDK